MYNISFIECRRCKRCNSRDIVKNGKRKLIQKYKCKKCHYNFVCYDSRSQPVINDKKVAAFILYEEKKISLCDISTTLGIKQETIIRWAKEEKARYEKEKRENDRKRQEDRDIRKELRNIINRNYYHKLVLNALWMEKLPPEELKAMVLKERKDRRIERKKTLKDFKRTKENLDNGRLLHFMPHWSFCEIVIRTWKQYLEVSGDNEDDLY